MEKTNIVLIGMPSAGKSTIGKLLAVKTGRKYIDTDIIIKEKQNMALRDIVIAKGHEEFLKIQEEIIINTEFDGFIIATGGSVVYSNNAMSHLKNNGIIIYLKQDFKTIEERVAPDRRFARNTEQSLLDLYNERTPLYEKNADIIIDCSNLSEEATAKECLKYYSHS